VRVGDLRDRLHVLGDEMADIDPVVEVELGQDVVIAGGRVDLGGDLPVREGARDRIGLAELALDLDEEGLHRVAPEAPLGPISHGAGPA
jgi:hypothetical protein